MKQTERPSDSCSGQVNFSVIISLFKCGSQYATRPRELQHVDTKRKQWNWWTIIRLLFPVIWLQLYSSFEFIYSRSYWYTVLVTSYTWSSEYHPRLWWRCPSCFMLVLFFSHCIIFFNHVSHSSFWFKPKHQQRESFQNTTKEPSWPPAWRRKSENLSLLLWAGRQDAGNLGQHECQMTFTEHKNSAVENWQVWNHKSVSCWKRRRRRRKRGWAVCSRRHASDIQFENTHIHSQQKIIAMCNTLQQWQWDAPLLFISRYMTSV